MEKKVVAILGLVVILAWFTGCATMGDVARAKHEGEGTTKNYPLNAD